MSEVICVHISSTAFSLLLYENAKSSNDQEGFLLGKVITKQRRIVTDNDQEVVNTERIIKINSILPCNSIEPFYSNNGMLNESVIKRILGDQCKNVVAWYKFKRLSSFKLTFREKIILKQLAKLFSPTYHEHFACLLTTEHSEPMSATCIFSQTFIRYNALMYQPIPMHIMNLNEPHDKYKLSEECSSEFKSIMKELRIDTKRGKGYNVIIQVEKALNAKIGQLVEKLGRSESELFKLEEEVKLLREKLTLMHECGDDIYTL